MSAQPEVFRGASLIAGARTASRATRLTTSLATLMLKLPGRPQMARIHPATAGPMTADPCQRTEFMAMADIRSDFRTRLGMSALRAGVFRPLRVALMTE